MIETTTCDKCNEIYPHIIFTCCQCFTKIGEAKGFIHDDKASRSMCWECYQKLADKAWKYEQLSK